MHTSTSQRSHKRTLLRPQRCNEVVFSMVVNVNKLPKTEEIFFWKHWFGHYWKLSKRLLVEKMTFFTSFRLIWIAKNELIKNWNFFETFIQDSNIDAHIKMDNNIYVQEHTCWCLIVFKSRDHWKIAGNHMVHSIHGIFVYVYSSI